MKELDKRSDNLDVLTRKQKALIAFFGCVLFAGVTVAGVYLIEERKQLRNKCVAEQVIDGFGNPGPAFSMEQKDPCDEFIRSTALRRAKGYMDPVLPVQVGW